MSSVSEQLASVRAFQDQLTKSLGQIVAVLYCELHGEVSDEGKRAIYEHLRALSERALDLPPGTSALRGLDLLVEMFPPPSAGN